MTPRARLSWPPQEFKVKTKATESPPDLYGSRFLRIDDDLSAKFGRRSEGVGGLKPRELFHCKT